MAENPDYRVGEEKIPIIDMANLYHVPLLDNEAVYGMKETARLLGDALHQYGFAYLTNHGIPKQLIENAFRESQNFFELPLETKIKFAKQRENVLTNFHGYAVPGIELLNEKSVHEHREMFDIIQQQRFFPTEDAPEFQPVMESLEDACRSFVLKLLKILALSMGLEDDLDFFCKAATYLTDKSVANYSLLRSNYYPALAKIDENENDNSSLIGVTRCSEHTDWDLLTILFQDDMGGLEVKKAANQWIPAPPIEDALIVNIGDLLETWTGGHFIATAHRVLVPKLEVQRRSARQSIGYFFFTDDNFLLEPLTNSPVIRCPENDRLFEPTTAYKNFMKKAGNAYGVSSQK